MDNKQMKEVMTKHNLQSELDSTINQRVKRYLEIEHQGIIGGHYFAHASSECIHLYRDGYFIGAVMMSHAINEGIIKFVVERNKINRNKEDGNTKTIEELICELKDKNIILEKCATASTKIWGSFRADIHHMNPSVSGIPFQKLAQQNLKHLSTIEREIFGHDIRKGAIAPHQPKYWDINDDGTMAVFLRLE